MYGVVGSSLEGGELGQIVLDFRGVGTPTLHNIIVDFDMVKQNLHVEHQ